MKKRGNTKQRKLTAEELLATREKEKRFEGWTVKQIEAYATAMTKIKMTDGAVKKRGKMWRRGRAMSWSKIDEKLNSNYKFKNTGKKLGFTK